LTMLEMLVRSGRVRADARKVNLANAISAVRADRAVLRDLFFI